MVNIGYHTARWQGKFNRHFYKSNIEKMDEYHKLNFANRENANQTISNSCKYELYIG